MALKRADFAGLGKREGKSVTVCWVGNPRVRERGQELGLFDPEE
jgi:hypothetical protein